jgi:hypothetical protein
MGESAAWKYRKLRVFNTSRFSDWPRLHQLITRASAAAFVRLAAESHRGASFRFRRLLFSILCWCVRFKRMDQASRDGSYFVDRSQERSFVGLRRFVESGDFPDELERRSANLVRRDRRIEIEKRFDVPAHSFDTLCLVDGRG